LPAIALLTNDGPGGSHFVVILNASSSFVEVIDGPIGAIKLLPTNDFERQWQGYLLVESDESGYLRWLYGVAVALGLATLIHVVITARRTMRPQSASSATGSDTMHACGDGARTPTGNN
jgi:hypothetical protein